MKKSVLGDAAIYAAGTVTRQLVGFLLLPLYTQHLTPADYGVVALLAFTLAIIEPFVGVRLGGALPKFYFEKDTDSWRGGVFGTALILTTVSTVIAIALLSTRSEEIALVLFGSSVYATAVAIFSVQLATQAIEFYGLTFLRIQKRPIAFISITLSKLVLQVALNVWLIVFEDMGVLGVVLAGSVSSVIYAIALSLHVACKIKLNFDITIAKRMLWFSWPLWYAGLASLYVNSASRYFIRYFDSVDSVGIYELAAKFAGVLTALVYSAFSASWDTARFELYLRNDRDEVFSNVFNVTSRVLLAIAVGIAVFSPMAIGWMSSVEFHKAGSLVPILVLASWLWCLTNFLQFSFLISSNTRVIGKINWLCVALLTVTNVVLVPQFGSQGAAVGYSITMLVGFLLCDFFGRQYFRIKIDYLPLLRSFVLSVVVVYVAYVYLSFESMTMRVSCLALWYCIYCIAEGSQLLRTPSVRAYVTNMRGSA